MPGLRDRLAALSFLPTARPYRAIALQTMEGYSESLRIGRSCLKRRISTRQATRQKGRLPHDCAKLAGGVTEPGGLVGRIHFVKCFTIRLASYYKQAA